MPATTRLAIINVEGNGELEGSPLINHPTARRTIAGRRALESTVRASSCAKVRAHTKAGPCT